MKKKQTKVVIGVLIYTADVIHLYTISLTNPKQYFKFDLRFYYNRLQ